MRVHSSVVFVDVVRSDDYGHLLGRSRWSRMCHVRIDWTLGVTPRRLAAPVNVLAFDYSGWPVRAEPIAPLVGFSGTLVVEHLQLGGLEAEDHVILAGVSDDGQSRRRL